MQTVSTAYLQAVRSGLNFVAVATHRNLVTGATTALDVVDGSVSVDATQNVRRTLTMTIPNDPATWDLLDTPAGEITVTIRVSYTDHDTEDIPIGVFVVDQDGIGYGVGDTIQVTAPDRWLHVQRNLLAPGSRSSVASNAAWREIKRLVEGAWPNAAYPFPGWAQLDTSATTVAGYLLWSDGNRETALMDASAGLVPANGLELFFDATGKAVLRPVPVLSPQTQPVWWVDEGANGVLVTANRTRDRSGFRNVIIASTNAQDVTFDPVVVAFTSAAPRSIYGPAGYVAEEWQGPFRNSGQASTAAKVRLSQRLGDAQQVSLGAVPNHALDARDVIGVRYPPLNGVSSPTELHMTDTLTLPLLIGAQQDIQTRSTQYGLG